MERWSGKVAIVTGASAGVGRAVAERLAKEGVIVAGLARRKEKMNELAATLKGCKGAFHPIQADITKEEDIIKAFQYIIENLGPIHILINNAGISRISPLSIGKTEDWNLIMDTNVMGLGIATREALQNMYLNKVDGHIIHVSSITGHNLAQNPNAFSGASKAAVTSLAESLRIELNRRNSKIKISCISPGYIDTEIMDIVRETNQNPAIQKYLDSFKMINPPLLPEDMADSILYMLAAPPNVNVYDIIIRPVGEVL
ncbi:farnesol dehydrogenase-like [Photinus pyralis]|uniref:farnesol dehydrogenase-like n=1 Tax=Photinus pyralis TaxID=7054 RepID=UPI0012677086|nr:farnesol dehydrogenase-like [Photinus pyralis]